MLALLLGTPAAYALARWDWKGKKDLWFWIISNRFMSPLVLALPFYILANQLGMLNNVLTLVILYLSFNVPLVVWITEWDTEEDAIKFQAQAFRLMKRVLPPDSELTAPVLRKKTGVVFGINVPKDLQDELLETTWKCKRTPGRVY